MKVIAIFAILLPVLSHVVGDGPLHPKEDVKIEVISKPPNCSPKSTTGDSLTIEYIGTFLSGKKFDSTYDRKQPMSFTMGMGEVIKGTEIGTMDMCVGEKRKLIIPPSLAYGDKKYAHIPPSSTLQFEVTLTELTPDPFKEYKQMAATNTLFS